MLVVDDSAFARKVLREVLGRAQDLEVVGVARDGLEALEKIAELQPDVITLDLVMPNLDGLGVLQALPKEGAPRVVVVSVSDAESELGLRALEAGAFDVVAKPNALATDRLYELAEPLTEVIRAAVERKPLTQAPLPVAPLAALGPIELVVIGTSTGGPPALTRLLNALPADFPCAIAVALHIPAGYTEALSRRLDETCALEVCEATEGLELRPGRVVIARGGSHLTIARREGLTFAHVSAEPLDTPHHPSVDVLFRSAAEAFGARALGLVLTGMGDDGLAGAKAIVAAGGRVLTEAASSCVVYGMPRVVREAGLSSGEFPLAELASVLSERVRPAQG